MDRTWPSRALAPPTRPPLDEVLERVERGHHAGLGHQNLDTFDELIQVRARRGDFGDVDGDETLAHGDVARVDDANVDAISDGVGGEGRGLVRRREQRGHRQDQHTVATVAHRSFVGVLEGAR